MNAHELEEILTGIPRLSALVVGDICLDRWARYDPALADYSRETGLPRIAVTSCRTTPGGGGVVASNLAALGLDRVAVLGMVGEDGHAWELRVGLERSGIETGMLISSPEVQTFTYTKLINVRTGIEDHPRVDFIPGDVPVAEARLMAEMLRCRGADFDVVLVVDQAETAQAGVVGKVIREGLSALAARRPEKILWVDSRVRLDLFRGLIAKCNRKEVQEACRRALGRVDYSALRKHLKAPYLVVTQGAEEVLLFGPRGEDSVPAVPESEPVDICGAGDSFSAAAATALAVTGSAKLAVEFGNLAAAVTIMKPGTGTADPAEIRARHAALEARAAQIPAG